MTGKLTARGVESCAKKKGRYSDGDGLFLRVLDPGKRVYWTYRYTVRGRERETSVGSYPETTLADARAKHAELRADVLKKIDPVAVKHANAAPAPSGAMTFGDAADQFLDRREKRGEAGRNAKHRMQWRSTLANLPAWFRDLPVDAIGPKQVFEALDPLWAATPETASRVRGRIAAVLDFSRGPDDRNPNPAAWAGWLKTKLGSAKKLGKIDRNGERVERGSHAAMAFAQVPALMAKLSATPGDAALALRFTILTACRTSEVLGATWDEVDFDKATWSIPASRMKMKKPHDVPLSAPAIAILRAQEAERGDSANPHVFPGRPMRGLSPMAMAMLLRRLGENAVTVHGFRSSFRDWAAQTAVPFDVAENCLAHQVGNAVTRSYLRTSVFELRQPVMANWGDHCCPPSNVVALRRA